MGKEDELYEAASAREEARAKCATCDHFDGPYLYADVPEEEADFLENQFGFCRALPMQVVAYEECTEGFSEPIFGWPEGNANQWCGQHEPRSGSPAETPQNEEIE